MIVIPIAGMSRRFTEAGYDRPKYMLPYRGRTVFTYAMESFRAYFASEIFLIVYRETGGSRAFLDCELRALGVPEMNLILVELSSPTRGQAETVAIGLREACVDGDAPLTIFNVDTFRPGFQHPSFSSDPGVDGYLEVFRGLGDHWSFVLPDPEADGCASEVTEKVRISDLCCTGLYHFATARCFFDLYEQAEAAENLQGRELYVAPLYNAAIARGATIRFHVIDRREVDFCGTPAEYEGLLARTPSDRKVAICISGQLRGDEAHLRRVAALAEEVGADVYISVWEKCGRTTLSGAQNVTQKTRIFGEAVAAMMPAGELTQMFSEVERLYSALPAEDAGPILRRVFPGAVIETEPETIELSIMTTQPDRNSMRMLYKIWRCNRLKRKGETERGVRYDWVIRMRPDTLPSTRLFLSLKSWEGMAVFPRSDRRPGWLHDIFWICTSSIDDKLASLFARTITSGIEEWRGIHNELWSWTERLGIAMRIDVAFVSPSDFSNPREQEIATRLIRDALRNEDFLLSKGLSAAQGLTLADLLDIASGNGPAGSILDLVEDAERFTGSTILMRGALTRLALCKNVHAPARAAAAELALQAIFAEIGQRSRSRSYTQFLKRVLRAAGLNPKEIDSAEDIDLSALGDGTAERFIRACRTAIIGGCQSGNPSAT